VVFIAKGTVVADGLVDEITTAHGHDSLEQMFLHLAAEHRNTEGRT